MPGGGSRSSPGVPAQSLVFVGFRAEQVMIV